MLRFTLALRSYDLQECPAAVSFLLKERQRRCGINVQIRSPGPERGELWPVPSANLHLPILLTLSYDTFSIIHLQCAFGLVTVEQGSVGFKTDVQS